MIWGLADRVRALLAGRRVTSHEGVAFVASEEGFVDHPYTDFAGVWTIGYGHAIRSGESFPAHITEDDARDLLRRDLAIAEEAVSRLVVVSLTQGQFDALVSFTFNLGTEALRGSSVLRLLNDGDAAGAAAAFELWCKARDPKTGELKVSPVLLRRRRRERALFEGA